MSKLKFIGEIVMEGFINFDIIMKQEIHGIINFDNI